MIEEGTNNSIITSISKIKKTKVNIKYRKDKGKRERE